MARMVDQLNDKAENRRLKEELAHDGASSRSVRRIVLLG